MAAKKKYIAKPSSRLIKDERGLATIETIPLLLIFVVFMGYGLGAFGIIHTGILHNIASRTYAFETFRHRPNVVYFRENRTESFHHYAAEEMRMHAVKHESDSGEYIPATERPINFGFANEPIGRTGDTHNRTVAAISFGTRTREDAAVNPAWIKVQYGICTNSNCGGPRESEQ